MRRTRWVVLVLAVGVSVALAVGGTRILQRSQQPPTAVARPVPPGDQEIAWLDHSSGGDSWQQFVMGLRRAFPPGGEYAVDVAEAFPAQTTAVPTVTLGRTGYAGRLHFRWYKVNVGATQADWVAALADRSPAPLALIGGSSTDSAVRLARALSTRAGWHGDPPLLFITQASAEELGPVRKWYRADDDPADHPADGRAANPQLIELHRGRSFRLCFTNKQIAAAQTEFVLQDPTLRPGPVGWSPFQALLAAAPFPWTAPLALGTPARVPATVHALEWLDDAYSRDLCEHLSRGLSDRLTPGPEPDRTRSALAGRLQLTLVPQAVPFGTGGQFRPNPHEEAVIRRVVAGLPPTGERSLLLLPTTTAAARRVLLALAERVPGAGRRIVALTGDAVSLNTIYRDAEFGLWPPRSIPIPLVMFTHNHPFNWDTPAAADAHARPRPRGTTDEQLLYKQWGEVVADAVFPPAAPGTAAAIAPRADAVLNRLKQPNPFFDESGNRVGGRDEHVVVLRPTLRAGSDPHRPTPDAWVEVYRRQDTAWVRVAREPIRPRADDGRPPE